jgi:beta-glucosidase-like glycosyl hydrolase
LGWAIKLIATLLTTTLREEWGWDGLVISDFIFGLRDAVRSVQAGLDIEMPFRQQRAVHLHDAVADGRLDVADVDAAVGRIVATLLRFAPLFDAAPDNQPFPFVEISRMASVPEHALNVYYWRVQITLTVYSAYKGQREVQRIISAMREALDDVILDLDEHACVRCDCERADTLRDADGETYMGTAIFAALVRKL